MIIKNEPRRFTATTNACTQCSPLGACLVFKGIEGCMPLIHGSQGCSTYIRRYLISHFREPVDIASSSFHEEAAVFGGQSNIHGALDNITNAYKPKIIGVCTTCLSETIGDDVQMLVNRYEALHSGQIIPDLVHVSTPSYQGSHAEGFHAAAHAMVKYYAETNTKAKKIGSTDHVNVFPGMVSPEDLREIKRIVKLCNQEKIMVPDYSDTLDGGSWEEYHDMPPGGTSAQEIQRTGSARLSIQFGHVAEYNETNSAKYLESQFGIPAKNIPLPIGIRGMDSFVSALGVQPESKEMPSDLASERARLIDSYLDGHKYLFGKRALVFGDEDIVVGLAAFLSEIGVQPVFCASGGKSKHLKEQLETHLMNDVRPEKVLEGADFDIIEAESKDMDFDFLIGNSKGNYIAKKLGVPLIRCGFPVHDRMGSQRIQHVGYRGTQALFDRIVNTLLEVKQNSNDIGWKYL